MDCIPDDWGDEYDNVTVGCTIENQEISDLGDPFLMNCQSSIKILSVSL